MSIYNFLQLQPVDPHDDGTTSDLDEYEHDETIDLQNDIDEQTLDAAWDQILKDIHKDPVKFNDK
jgi:hypothetical protein